MKDRISKGLCAVLCVVLLASCGGPEQKKMKFFNKGNGLFAEGEFVKASLEFRNAIQIDPKFADAYHMLGMTEIRRQNLKGAYGAFTKAVELDPGHFKAHNQLGRLFLAVREPDMAMEKAERILTEAPGDEDALLLKGAVLVARKDFTAADGYLEGLIGKGVRSPDAYELLAAARRRKGDAKGAEEALRRGIAADGTSVALHRALVDLLVRGNRFDDAAAEVRKIIELEPKDIGHRIALAGLYWSAGREPLAREILAQVVAADSKKEDGRIRVAGFYAAANRPAEAERELQEGIKANGKSYRLRFALADLYMNLNMAGRAVTVLKEALGLDRKSTKPEALQARTALAKAHLQRQETGEAEKLVDEVLKESPKNVEARFLKGNLLLLKGDGLNAVSEFRTVVSETPQFLEGHVRLAEAHAMNREMKLAEDTLRSALKNYPDAPVLERAVGLLYVRQKEFRKGEEHFRKLLGENPDNLEIRVDLGDLYLAAGDRGKAEAAYDSVRKKAPALPIGHVKLSRLYQVQGKWDRAAAEMEQAAKLNPRAETVFASLVEIRIRQNKPEAAVVLLDERIRRNPKDAFAYYLLGQVRAAQRDTRKAEEAFRQAMALQPDSMAPYLALGQLYTGAREYAKAKDVYEKVLSLQPDQWAAANDLAFLLSEEPSSGSLDKALALAERALKLRPDEPTVLDTLGWIRHKKGQAKQAVDLLSRVQAKAPDSPIANYHLGMALHKAGRQEDAKKYLAKSLAAKVDFPGRDDARKTLETL
ncbi:MAG TPA: hypothetical protein DD658_03825 [Deltaproteobacteria bacterium]|nr:hypothetical protein [Deltaproteobacteria bacterium]